MTQNVLMVLQPRCIRRCVESIAALPIDKVWFRAFDEFCLPPVINQFIQTTQYRDYLIVSDDVVASSNALGAVAEGLQRYPAVTGWCEVDASVPWANLARAPLRLTNGESPVASDYCFYRVKEVLRQQSSYFRTFFAGWALTGLRRDLWLRFPFEVNPETKCQSDFQTSYRLQKAGIPIYAARDGYVQHLRPDAGPLKDHWLVGRETPKVLIEEFTP